MQVGWRGEGIILDDTVVSSLSREEGKGIYVLREINKANSL